MKRFILFLLGSLTVCVILAGCNEKLTLDQTQLDMTVGDSAELSKQLSPLLSKTARPPPAASRSPIS